MIARATTVCTGVALSAVLAVTLTACGAASTDGKPDVGTPSSTGARSTGPSPTGSSSDPDFPTADPSASSSSTGSTSAPTATPPTSSTRPATFFTVSLPTGWRQAKATADAREYYGPSASGGQAVVAVTRGTTPVSASYLDSLTAATVQRFKTDSSTVSVGSTTKTTVDGEQARRFPIVLTSSGLQVAVKVTLVVHGGYGITITEALPAKAPASLGAGADKVVDSLRWT